MSKKSDELVRQTQDLIETIKQLRDALLGYQRSCERLLKAGEQGRRASSTVERLELLKFADTREHLMQAMKAFEVARHNARVGLVGVTEEEGSNLSEVAKTLGVSRQLMSRLTIEGRRQE